MLCDLSVVTDELKHISDMKEFGSFPADIIPLINKLEKTMIATYLVGGDACKNDFVLNDIKNQAARLVSTTERDAALKGSPITTAERVFMVREFLHKLKMDHPETGYSRKTDLLLHPLDKFGRKLNQFEKIFTKDDRLIKFL
jgi:hypothetical protein